MPWGCAPCANTSAHCLAAYSHYCRTHPAAMATLAAPPAKRPRPASPVEAEDPAARGGADPVQTAQPMDVDASEQAAQYAAARRRDVQQSWRAAVNRLNRDLVHPHIERLQSHAQASTSSSPVRSAQLLAALACARLLILNDLASPLHRCAWPPRDRAAATRAAPSRPAVPLAQQPKPRHSQSSLWSCQSPSPPAPRQGLCCSPSRRHRKRLRMRGWRQRSRRCLLRRDL